MRLEKVSICMATYNGAKFLNGQINSILKQLEDDDELIIIDDSSNDSTLDILREFKDSRIKIFVNELNMGVNKSFEKAITHSKNDFIFMADQDDIWYEDRVEKMLNALRKSNVNLVSGNSYFIDANSNKIDYPVVRLKENESRQTLRNIFKIFIGTAAYCGCAMAFKRELLNVILPFPNYIESHDLWIAKAGLLQRKSYHIEDIVLYRRIHGNNVSIVRRSLMKKIWSRFIFLISIINLVARMLKVDKK